MARLSLDSCSCLTFSHSESTDPPMSQWTKCKDGEIVPGSSRGWVSNPLSMIDCFTAGFVIYKQGNCLLIHSPWPLYVSFQHTHTHLIYINSPAAVSLLLLLLLWPHYLFISCLRMPALLHHPSSSSLLTKRWEEGTPLKEGHVPLPQTQTHTYSGLYLNTPSHEFTCMTGSHTGPWWAVCVLTVASPWPITIGGSGVSFKSFEQLLCFVYWLLT